MNEETKLEIKDVLRQVASCPIHVGWMSNRIGTGERKSCYRGSGYDFDSIDDYEPGDDPRQMDWTANAQFGGQRMFKKTYREERQLRIFILQDVNPSMRFGTVRATKLRLSAELAAAVCRSATETHDRLGFMSYSQSKVEAYLAPRSAHSALTPVLASIFESRVHPANKKSGLVEALGRLPSNGKSLVFVISDFLHLTEEEKSALKRVAVIHDVICLIVQDRRERELPPGWGPLVVEDMRTGQRSVIFLTDKARRTFAQNAKAHQDQLLALLDACHCSWMITSTEEGQESMRKVIRLFATH